MSTQCSWKLVGVLFFFVLSFPNLRSVAQEDSFLKKWKEAVESNAYKNCRLKVESRAVSVENGEILERMESEVLLKGKAFRSTLKIFEPDGTLVVAVEQCGTDQHLHVQAKRKDGSASMNDLRLSGYLQEWDRRKERSIALGQNAQVLGSLYHPAENERSIAEIILSNRDQDLIELKEGTKLRVRYDVESELPHAIVQEYHPWLPNEDTLKRNTDMRMTLGMEAIQWSEVDGIPFIKEFNELMGANGRFPKAYVRKVQVSEFEPNASLAEADFRPSFPVEEGTDVSVQDFNVKAEWRDGRIETITAEAYEAKKRTSAPTPLAIGAPAPEFEIEQWSDERKRLLKDFRGKVVVIDFWGIWCKPCLAQVPKIKELQDRYEANGVVFFAIHTARTEMKEILEVVGKLGWKITVGRDTTGKAEAELLGKTKAKYAVSGFPTMIVIDREGRVRFNGRYENLDLATLARKSGLPSPEQEGISDKEKSTRIRAIKWHVLRNAIEAARAEE